MKSKKPNTKEILEKLFDAIEENVSSDARDAVEYLDEQGVDHLELVQENVNMVKKLQAQYLLDKGEEKQKWFEQKKKEFLQLLKTAPEQIKNTLSSPELQVSFRKLNTDNISEEDIDNLFEDTQFLNYLDKEFSDEKE